MRADEEIFMPLDLTRFGWHVITKEIGAVSFSGMKRDRLISSLKVPPYRRAALKVSHGLAASRGDSSFIAKISPDWYGFLSFLSRYFLFPSVIMFRYILLTTFVILHAAQALSMKQDLSDLTDFSESINPGFFVWNRG